MNKWAAFSTNIFFCEGISVQLVGAIFTISILKILVCRRGGRTFISESKRIEAASIISQPMS